MTSHNAENATQDLRPERRHRADVAVIASGSPDPYRLAGVPDRLVLVLNRDGSQYVGSLATWEYRELKVSRRVRQGEDAELVTEMVVDVSYPTRIELTVPIAGRPTPALLVDELVRVLDEIVPTLP